jgi:hypothetical protein
MGRGTVRTAIDREQEIRRADRGDPRRVLKAKGIKPVDGVIAVFEHKFHGIVSPLVAGPVSFSKGTRTSHGKAEGLANRFMRTASQNKAVTRVREIFIESEKRLNPRPSWRQKATAALSYRSHAI